MLGHSTLLQFVAFYFSSQGLPGNAGPKGEVGDTGAAGDRGTSGQQGIKGQKGETVRMVDFWHSKAPFGYILKLKTQGEK